MSAASKVERIVAGLREEEERLRAQLVEAEGRVKGLKAEVSRVRAGVRALRGKGGGKRHGHRGAKHGAPKQHSDQDQDQNQAPRSRVVHESVGEAVEPARASV